MKVYRIPAKHIWVNTVFGNLLLAGMLVWAVSSYLGGRSDFKIQMLLIALPLILISALIGIHQPTTVELTDETITFSGLGRRHTYAWSDIRYMFVRKFLLGDRYLVQIGDFHLYKGRYWVPMQMEGYKELLAFLQAKEAEICPKPAKVPRPKKSGR